MKHKVILLAILFSVCSYSQDLQTAYLGNFKLVNGKEIKDCKVCYRTIGRLNDNKTNVLLYPTWFGGKSENLVNLSHNLLDTANYFIIAVDALGNGVSSSPSNSTSQPDSLFPEISIKDMVNSQYELLTNILGISRLAGIIGGSMGGMQVFQWVVSYPEFMDKAIAYVGSPRLTPFDLMLWNTEIQAIEIWEKGGGSKDDLAGLVTTIHNLLITTPENKNSTVNRDDFQDYISDLKNNFKKSFQPYDWKSQLKAMCLHDISINNSMDEAAALIKTDFLIILGATDLIVNPQPAMDFADKYNFKKYVFENDCGHLSPGCEFQVYKKLVNDFFNDKPLN